jgi:GDPmannose 4,6-dehydratase
MYLMLQQPSPDDFVIATGKTTEVREFVRKSFAEAGMVVEFKGEGVEEKGILTGNSNDSCKLPLGSIVVEVDPQYFRPTEVDLLLGDPSKANRVLG